MESLAKPVARYHYTLTLPTGATSISGILDHVNGEIKQITFKTPALGGKTATLTILDELGAEIYNSGAKTQSSTYKLITSAVFVPLAGVSTITITVSGAQAAPVVFHVLLFIQ